MILVVGGTGALGLKIVNRLRALDRPVRVLARSSSNTGPVREAGAGVVTGDLKDPASLAHACQDVDAIITTASASKTGDDAIETVDGQGNQTLITAAEAAGVQHFILVSTVGASPDNPVAVFKAKGQAEQRLRNGKMPFTILQPNAFMDIWFPMLIEQAVFSHQPVTLVGESRRRHSFVAEQDVAAYAVAALDRADARNATLVIGGPEAVTLRDVVRIYGEVLGREIDVNSVAPGEPIPGLPPAVGGIAAALETYDSPIPMDQLSRSYGIPATGVRSLVQSRVSALSHAQ